MDGEETLLRDVSDVEGIVSCFRANGVVAVTNVLTKAECEESLEDIASIVQVRTLACGVAVRAVVAL